MPTVTPKSPALELLTVADLSELTKLRRQWIYDNLWRIPHVRIGSQIRFRPDEIDAWLSGQAAGQRASA